MENMTIDASERSPGIDFNFADNTYAITGESYPENIAEFYGPVMDVLSRHLESLNGVKLVFNFELLYFNSSSAKVFMKLFNLLDETAENNDVVINWYFEEDDDNMEELGEEYGEDLEHAVFNLVTKT